MTAGLAAGSPAMTPVPDWGTGRLTALNCLMDWKASFARRKTGNTLRHLGGAGMVNPHSELYQNHPEWVIGLPHRENRQERSQYLLDLSNPHVCRYILDAMRKLLGGHPGISYVKWDCNRKISDPGSPWLDACRQGNLPIDYVRGYERILETLAAEFPDVIFQACSSGGGRADYGTMRKHHEFWTSDNTDAYERVFMQWGIGHLFPAISMAAHVTASPNHQTGRSAPLKFRFDVAMSGRLGFELQPCDMTEEDMVFPNGLWRNTSASAP